MPRPARWWRRGLYAAASAALVVVVSGCSLVGVRMSDEAGAPLRIGAQPTMGPEPDPTETQDPALADQALQHLTFSGNCPARVSLHVPKSWTGNVAATSFNARPSSSGFDGPRLSVYCSEAYGNSPSDAVASSQRFQFSGEGTTMVAELTGQAGPGYFWTFEAEMGPEESWVISDDEPTSAVGSNVAYPIAGKVYEIRFAYYYATNDDATRALAIASIGNLTVEGSPIGAPSWPDGGSTHGTTDADAGDGSADDTVDDG